MDAICNVLNKSCPELNNICPIVFILWMEIHNKNKSKEILSHSPSMRVDWGRGGVQCTTLGRIFFFLSGFYLCHIFNFADSLVLSYKKQPNNIFSWYSGVHLIAYWITAYLIYWDKISMYGIASLQIYSNSVIIIAYFSHHIDISIQNFI